MIKRILAFLQKPVIAAPLISFKLIFGALMVFSSVRFMALGWIEDHYVNPVFHFKYWGFEWVETLSRPLLYVVHIVMILSALGIMFARKWWYRISAILLFVTFTYTELIDLTYYLNHYYFVSLTCLLLCFLPAENSILKGSLESEIPNWTILIIKAQLSYVYFFAGIAKINYEWLFNAMPLKIWLPAHDTMPFIGELFTWKLTPYFFSWAGMIYDCSIVFFLVYKPKRFWAYLAIVFFHGITGALFQIGVFPLVMIGGTLIFFSDEWHIKLLGFFRKLFKVDGSKLKVENTMSNTRSWVLYLFIPFFVFQVLFPFRYLLYKGNPFWTEQGYRYGWRVMLMEKAGTATFYVKDSKTGREGIAVNSEFLNPHQEKQMAMQPDMILQFAHFLAQHYTKKGMFEPQVRAEVYVTLNGRPSQLLIDPTIDLTKENDTFAAKKWILESPK